MYIRDKPTPNSPSPPFISLEKGDFIVMVEAQIGITRTQILSLYFCLAQQKPRIQLRAMKTFQYHTKDEMHMCVF